MVPIPPEEASNFSAPDFLMQALRDLRGYQPPSVVGGVIEVRQEYRLLAVLNVLQEVQMSLDVLQANQELALDHLGHKIACLERVMEEVVLREHIDR